MKGKKLLWQVMSLVLTSVFVLACGLSLSAPTPVPTPTLTPVPPTSTPTPETVSGSDLAVCDAYQHLVDVWPADSEAVQAAKSAQEIYEAIEDAGAELVITSQSADDPELARLGEAVGEAAVEHIQMDESARQIGFVPFFEESYIGGEVLSQLCAEMGRPISLP
jgi:hypothetical protein